MVTVEQATQIVLNQNRDFGTTEIYFEDALGRVLAEPLKADRDLPPYDRVTMDGIAINYAAVEKGIRSFNIIATQAAGDEPAEIKLPDECIEIMTGAALPSSADTVIRYEDLQISNGIAAITIPEVIQGQSIHFRGKDKRQHEVLVESGQLISPAVIQIAASTGKQMLCVKALPKVVVISSGDELVPVNSQPTPYQVRRSNGYTLKAALQQYGINAVLLHIPDDPVITTQEIAANLALFDVIILSGGVSEGRFDYIPRALLDCGVEQLFHKVKQRPGKPFWFGRHGNSALVYALPGNPVSAFMCLHRYVFPWLEKCLGIGKPLQFARLGTAFTFSPALQYFLQVSLTASSDAELVATPLTGNGSGDFANLVEANAFMELPLERDNFTKGELFPVWRYQ